MPSVALRPTYLRKLVPEPVVNTPRFIAPLSTLKPMASGSLLAGSVTVPKASPGLTLRLAPVPRYNRALEMRIVIKSPVITAPLVPIDGSTTVDRVLWVISTVALP